MKITKRIACAALAGLLALSMAACKSAGEGGSGPAPTPTPTQEATPTPETQATSTPGADPSAQPTEPVTADLVETEDAVQKVLGFSRDTAVMTVDGVPVTAENYLYCLGYATEMVCSSLYEDMSQVDWTAEVEGVPLTNYITDSAVETATFYAVIRAKAAENGVAITEEEQASLDNYIINVITGIGGKEMYAQQLGILGISDQGFRALNEVSILYDDLEKKLFGSAEPTDEELADFAEKAVDALMAKHILIKTVDDNRQPLPAEEREKATELAKDLLAQLRASDDPLTLFDELMNEYSEDGRTADGKLAAPDGYLFTANQMVAEFEQATRDLEYYEISDLVESPYGYHIILRLPPVNDEVRVAWVSNAMNDQVSEWVHAAEVETTEEFAQMDPKSCYEKMDAYRAELLPEETGN